MLFYQHPSKKLRNIISESQNLGDLVTRCLNLGVRFAPGFPLYLFPLRSKRMPLQSLTQLKLKIES